LEALGSLSPRHSGLYFLTDPTVSLASGHPSRRKPRRQVSHLKTFKIPSLKALLKYFECVRRYFDFIKLKYQNQYPLKRFKVGGSNLDPFKIILC